MPHSRPAPSGPSELQREQRYVDLLYRRVDDSREEVARRLGGALREEGGTAQARVERGVEVDRLTRRLTALDAAEKGLCFGRLETTDGERRYIGRIGIRDPDTEDPLLIDWRAPAARPFYTATAAAPQGMLLRRHLHARGRTVVRIDDERLDGTGPLRADVQLSGEAALLTALEADRTGRMRDAVATLQAEQDRIIRSPGAGVLVVQGGPGTGKTVVALHRAAYLLYTNQRLFERGVLVVGPNPVFLGYISQVLPSLGETNVLLSSLDELFPGAAASRVESERAGEIKGRAVMADILATAVRHRQAQVDSSLDGPVAVEIGGEDLHLEPELLADAVAQAHATGAPHNVARPVFCRVLIEELARRLANVITELEDQFEEDIADRVDAAALDRAVNDDLAGLFGPDDQLTVPPTPPGSEIKAAEEHWLDTLPHHPAMRRLLERLWPTLTPRRLLDDLFADPDRLAAAAPQLTPDERAALRRPPGGGWAPADVPLLDEAEELLGFDRVSRRDGPGSERAAEIEYAQGVLDIARGSRAGENENPWAAAELTAADLMTAAEFAAANRQTDDRTVAERAARDRTWVFGHVIVDEAQDVSPMAWRLLLRRCPSKNFTVVGDVAQTGEAAGPGSWSAAMEPFFGDRWRRESLTINYRTPVEIMAASDRVIAEIDPEGEIARAVRTGGDHPRLYAVPRDALPGRLAELVKQEVDGAGDGRVGLIVPAADLDRLATAVQAEIPGLSWGRGVDLERPVVALSARQSKGLEFDSVVLADPGAMVDASPRGLNDLYVALTRASRRLVVVCPDRIPDLFAHLAPARLGE
ncbi:AAA family ATPase [Actinomadura meridiana]|uniref:AAA family ATPase n=1 Tax=Actinomadura meridiana TaxID=559626 RepID=A0ABP8CJM4_9ACTN